jgi:circadian clock protein KaiC
VLGGGADRNSSLLLLGPSGTGKSTVATQFVMAAANRGEPSALFIFDERIETFLQRGHNLGLDLRAHVEGGRVQIQQVDAAELTAGEFAHTIRRFVVECGVRFVLIDSLAGYFHAMPDERSLILHLHELVAFLSQQDVTVLLVMTEHGLPGGRRHALVDLSYLADSILLFHDYEHAGQLGKAISVYKRRAGAHESSLRQLEIGPRGIRIGQPLRQFQGILTGTPEYSGDTLPNVGEENAG